MLFVRDLTCTRGGIPVLQSVNLALPPGEALILRGPNGSGKTTLLRTIAGLQPPAAGSVDCTPDSIAYGGHADGLKSALTVAENLEFWAEIYGTKGIDTALKTFDIVKLRGRLAQTIGDFRRQ